MITDVIHLSHEQDLALSSLWRKSREAMDGNRIPADLFFANTLPLKNIRIEVDERDDNGYLMSADFCAVNKRFPDSNYILAMGVVVNMERPIWGSIIAEEGKDYLSVGYITAKNKAGKMEFLPMEIINKLNADVLFGAWLVTWYGVQIAMLHPTVKEIFLNPKAKKERVPKEERKKNDYKVYRYVRHHYINSDELKSAMYGKNSYNRKTLVWYVTGHWRHYKSGKIGFIQPYWKGALREVKQAEARNREIIINKEGGKTT